MSELKYKNKKASTSLKEKLGINIIVDNGFNDEYKIWLKKFFNANFFKFEDIIEEKSIDGLKYLNIKKDYIPIKIDLILFTGGSDVDPQYYGEEPGLYTSFDSKRDELEKKMFETFQHIPKLGICRGSQFLTVLSKGKLIQHVEGHGKDHKIHVFKHKYDSIKDIDPRYLNTYNITSTHHQMMFPFDLPKKQYTILAWSKRYQSNCYLNGKNEEISLPTDFVEPEIVFYPFSRSLCVQGHPEYSNCPIDTQLLIIELIEKFLLNERY